MRLIFYIIIVLIVAASCKKDKFEDDIIDGLSFSTDTLTFDTVFTEIGSATRYFKVYNISGKDIKIKRIYLSGNNGFRLNINGVANNSDEDVILRKDDSLFVFVEVNVDPNSSPMTILDSVMFDFASSSQKLFLLAFGQNVHLINGEIFSGSVFWPNDLPYLIYNSMLVDTNSTLTIASGARLHFHNKSRMYVAGTLIANGTKDEMITFQGDRLETWYKDIPGQWDGIYFLPGSTDNYLTYCTVKNAIVGIQADTIGNINAPTVSLMNVNVFNMNAVGIYGRGTSIHAVNTVVSNCGQYAILVVFGGTYEFYHCTVYNDWAYSNRTTPSLLINNYYQDVNGVDQIRPLERATFANCILYGSKENEIYIDKHPNSNVFEFRFDHCIIKAGDDINTNDASHFVQIYKNLSPQLINPSFYNFEPDSMSNSIDKGYNTMYWNDFNQNPRNVDTAPDLGAYERVIGH